MQPTHSDILLHIIFGTRQRQPDIEGRLRARLYEYTDGAVSGMKVQGNRRFNRPAEAGLNNWYGGLSTTGLRPWLGFMGLSIPAGFHLPVQLTKCDKDNSAGRLKNAKRRQSRTSATSG